MISADNVGIRVVGVSTFSGGISNSGTILASLGTGINVSSVSQFGSSSVGGGITNSGMISAAAFGIKLSEISAFSGNVSNSGTIIAGIGIVIGTGVTFAAGGAIVNSGVITGTGGTAIDLSAATSPVTVDINGGTVAGNMLGAGPTSGDTLNFALGGGKTFTYGSNFENFDTVNVNSGIVVLNGTSNSAATSM